MSNQLPLPTPAQNVVLDTSKLSEQSSASVWDRITNWVSDNKAAVYTIAGVAVVVTGAGVVYYLNDNTKSTPSVPKKSKKQRRTEKKKAEEEKKTASVKDGRSIPNNHGDRMTDMGADSPQKTEEVTEELPEVDEATVGQLSEEVC